MTSWCLRLWRWWNEQRKKYANISLLCNMARIFSSYVPLPSPTPTPLNYRMPVESSSYKHEMQVISIICIAFSNTKSFRSLPSLILWLRIRYLLTPKMPMEWNSYSWKGVGRVLSKVFYGEPPPSPKVQVLPSYIPFMTEKVPLSYTFHQKLVPL